MAARKALLATAGLTTYGASSYAAFLYFSPPRKKNDASATSPCACGSSCVADPLRNARYDVLAPDYDAKIDLDETLMGIGLLRRCLLFFHAAGDVLEVGAGTGRNLPYYRADQRVTLTDASPAMVAVLRDKLPRSTKMTAERSDGARLGERWGADAFDTVVDTFGLCSFDDPVGVLRQMRRVCRPDGKILLLEHGRTKKWDFLNRMLDDSAEEHAREWGCVWNRDIDRILEEAGLEAEVQRTWHFGTTYYLVCRPNSKEVTAELRTNCGSK